MLLLAILPMITQSNNIPLASIIIPCRNEKRYIGKCLDSIINNEYPKDRFEVLVVDGMSEDGTGDIVEKYCQKYSFIKHIDNHRKIVPVALNLGIQNARGEIIIRMDAHNIYEKDYISKCVKYLKQYNADNVGGICITMPGNNTVMAESIALALSHPFGVGNSYFRIGLKEPKYVDTVPFGCYERDVFDKIGLFNEALVRNQDIDFNLRLKNEAGKILLVPDIASYYHARSTLRALARNNFWNGFWVIYSLRFSKLPFSVRHLVPSIFLLFLICSSTISLFYRPSIFLFFFIISIYLITNIFYSFSLSFKKGFKYLPFLFVSFITLHFSYGFGSIYGLLRVVKFKFDKIKDYPIMEHNDKL